MKVNIPKKGVYVPQGPFISMGEQLTEYWNTYEANFPKLAHIAKVLRKWPTTSTSYNINQRHSMTNDEIKSLAKL